MRRTISLSDLLDEQVKSQALPGESYSATVARLLEEGIRVVQGRQPPAYIGAWKDGPSGHVGRDYEEYLFNLVEPDEGSV
jgi:hypothetical protein